MSDAKRVQDARANAQALALEAVAGLATTVNTSEPGTQPDDHPYVITIAVDVGEPKPPFVLRRGVDSESEARELYNRVEMSLSEGSPYPVRTELRETNSARVLGNMTV